MSRANRPEGSITRGTTNPNRLRRFDRWIIHRLGRQIRDERAPVVVDLGFGASPVTTLELAQRMAQRVGPGITVVGVEIDASRVELARQLEQGFPGGVRFLRGGFEIPLPGGERPLLVRACNVLRQYPVQDVPRAWAIVAGRLAPGGLLVDGTSDELGRLCAWVSIPCPDGASQGEFGVVPDEFTISVDLRTLDRPSRVAERLPKALIHRNVPGEPVHALLVDLDRAWDRAAALAAFGPRQRWVAAVRDLRDRGLPVRAGPQRWRLGELTVPWSTVAPIEPDQLASR
ncbi:MAG: class I SAM-dependent methyltransferase [Candidatus Nanopelagicales bacterium]